MTEDYFSKGHLFIKLCVLLFCGEAQNYKTGIFTTFCWFFGVFFANQEAAMIRISADLLSLYIHVSFLCFLGKFLPVRVLFLYRNQKEKNSNLTRTDFYVHSC